MKQRSHRRWIVFLIMGLSASPVLLAYLTYYVAQPEARSNYGELIDPRVYPVSDLGVTGLDGKPASLDRFHGRWMLLQVAGADCQQACIKKLYYLRQLQLAQGKDGERIARVWLITDNAPLDIVLMKQYEGTYFLRVDPEKLAVWLPASEGSAMNEYLYLIDPMGNLMMRFPADLDPEKIQKDISRLLKASRIG